MLTLDCGENSVRVPATVYVTLTDLTGDFVGLWDAASYGIPMSGAGGAASGGIFIEDANGATWSLQLAISCSEECNSFGPGFGEQAFFMVLRFEPNAYGLSEYCSFPEHFNGWGTSVFGLGPFKSETCRLPEVDPLILAPEQVVIYRTENPGFPSCSLAGTYSLWVSA